MCRSVLGSSPDVGSSRKKMRGWVSSSMPMLERLRWPPLSMPTRSSARSASPSCSSAWSTAASSSLGVVSRGSRSLAE